MQPLVTIVIPYAPYHADVVNRAVASVEAQTVSCDAITVEDSRSRGTGWARNRGLQAVKSDFVIFLDADDEIDPTFVEKTLAAYEPGHYVYTDWLVDKTVHHSVDPWILKPTDEPNRVYSDWHVITALLPTEAVRAVGGFDESLPAIEDTYFYWALTRAGICGICVPEPLFIYGKEGQRAKNFIDTPARQILMQELVERYAGMGCCGDEGPVQPATQSEVLQDGFVWAQAIWGGNRQQRGQVSGLLYPRTGNGKIIQVDRRDVQAQPHLFREYTPKPAIPTPPKPNLSQIVVLGANGQPIARHTATPAIAQPVEAHGVGEVAARLFPQVETQTGLTADEQAKIEPAKVKPNVAKVRKLAQGRKAK